MTQNIKGVRMMKHRPKKELETKASSFRSDLSANIGEIRRKLGDSPDIVYREFGVGDRTKIRIAVVYAGGLADKKTIHEYVVRSIMTISQVTIEELLASEQSVLQHIKEHVLTLSEVKIVSDLQQLIQAVLRGDTIILADGCAEAIVGGTKGGETRPVMEPSTELSIRGPKDSFNESLETKISLIRRRIQVPDLRVETMKIGKLTLTDVSIMYIKGLADENIVQEVKQRLNRIKTDSILGTGYIEEFIQDRTSTPFPTMFNTERPDVASGNLLEGRIAILAEGTPFVLIVPTVLTQFFKSAEDYFQRFDISTAIRLLRYVAFIISLVGPSIYIALITFHQEMIPTPLLISLAAQREGVPFPAFIEACMMEASFEVIREAGVRMPRAVGQAVSIVGALILGQAAVQAGIVSATMVIVVAATGIASFSAPSYTFANAARILRFLFMAMSAMFGFLGLTLGVIMLIAHLSALRSFGVPYLRPFAPWVSSKIKDTVLRLPYIIGGTAPQSENEK